MSNKIFETMLAKPKPTRRWLFFPISILFHGLLVAAIITVPLMMADTHFPEMKVVDVFMVAPKPPPPPPPPKGSGEGGNIKEKPDRLIEKPEQRDVSRFLAPIEIPDRIREEPFDFSQFRGGVPGIAAEGAPDWGENNPIFETKVDPQAKPLQISRIEMPKLIKRAVPQYPIAARKAHIEGIVKIEAFTDIYGRVVKVRALKGHLLLRSAAINAVRQWVYEPYIINGMPKPVKFAVDIHFRLQK